MKKRKINSEKISKSLYWTPRILSIILLCFLILSSLDVFSLGLNFWETIGTLFMHLIKALIVSVVLIVSWKYEIVGGIGFILGGIWYIITTLVMQPQFEWYLLAWAIEFGGLAFLVGTLFLIGWYRKTR